jgi:multidrug efflux pump subunit AcrA (membrane-fusion protein)
MTMTRKTLSISIFFGLLWACSREGELPRRKTTAEPVRGVEVNVIAPEPVEDFFEAVGTVKPGKSTMLSSKVVGNIAAVSVREGERVRKGQLLVEIDSRELDAELQAAKAGLEESGWGIKAAESAVEVAKRQRDLAAATFKRYESLAVKGSVTPQEFDEVKAQYQVASAELERAQDNLRALRARQKQAEAKVSYAQTLLAYTRITSPFDGVVTAKTAEIGMLAAPGSPLMTLEQIHGYRLEVQVGESWLEYARIGKPVEVRIDALKAGVAGKVVELTPSADPQSRTFTVKIELPSHPALHSGLYGKARFSLGKKEILLAPSEAIVEKGQLLGLFVVDQEGTARLRLVKTGKRYDRRVEILSGLEAGERIAVRGVEKLADGSRVATAAPH